MPRWVTAAPLSFICSSAGDSHSSQSMSLRLEKTLGDLRTTTRRTTVFRVSQPTGSGLRTLRGTEPKVKTTNGSRICLRVDESSQNVHSLFSCSDSTRLVNGIFEKSISSIIELQGMEKSTPVPLSFWTLIINLYLTSHLDIALRSGDGWKEYAFQPLEWGFLILWMRIRIHILSASPKRSSVKSSHLSVIPVNSRLSEDVTAGLLKRDVWKGHILTCTC